jgi:hypothetical protein
MTLPRYRPPGRSHGSHGLPNRGATAPESVLATDTPDGGNNRGAIGPAEKWLVVAATFSAINTTAAKIAASCQFIFNAGSAMLLASANTRSRNSDGSAGIGRWRNRLSNSST